MRHGRERRGVVGIDAKPCDVVLLVRDDGFRQELSQRDFSQGALGSHPFRGGASRHAGQQVVETVGPLAARVDALIVGGGIANTFILAAHGHVGKSLVEADLVGEAQAILDAFDTTPSTGTFSPGRTRKVSPTA
jgi:hypothetical protein